MAFNDPMAVSIQWRRYCKEKHLPKSCTSLGDMWKVKGCSFEAIGSYMGVWFYRRVLKTLGCIFLPFLSLWFSFLFFALFHYNIFIWTPIKIRRVVDTPVKKHKHMIWWPQWQPYSNVSVVLMRLKCAWWWEQSKFQKSFDKSQMSFFGN
jgi:hypothetical protein